LAPKILWVKSWRLDITTGQLEFDWEFTLVETNGAVMRLQSFPQMVKICPSINLQRKTLTATAPGIEELVLEVGFQQHCALH
jgi:uncharacterized protein YcbX